MIRKIIIVVLTLASVGLSGFLVEAYRPHPLAYAHPEARFRFGDARVSIYRTVRRSDFLPAFARNDPIGLLGITYFGPQLPLRPTNQNGVAAFSRCGFDLIRRDVPYVAGFNAPSSYFGAMRNGTSCALRIPLWAPIVLFVAYPALAFIRGPFCRYRRRKRGLCVTCGFDLRGSPGRCPECGNERA